MNNHKLPLRKEPVIAKVLDKDDNVIVYFHLLYDDVWCIIDDYSSEPRLKMVYPLNEFATDNYEVLEWQYVKSIFHNDHDQNLVESTNL